MIYKVFTIYDSKAEAYLPPFYFAATGQAIRAFTDMANERGHQINLHPEDYTLFEIGTFDDSDAEYIQQPAKTPLGNALEYVSLARQKQPELFPDNGAGTTESGEVNLPPVSIR